MQSRISVTFTGIVIRLISHKPKTIEATVFILHVNSASPEQQPQTVMRYKDSVIRLIRSGLGLRIGVRAR
ncbi:hypothetical protein Q31b_50850 [Novipirellula aureliae]|uniref:Uncharacterized protein n=1 Tax=Novipirellula aureliae TaxID=2527966 RepID=A0A5C6DFU5_9BACT|nr:hypothetical protein [Novipirellula aureliae]TWU35650.1 hypothetical protein Q31b_50850 [Novipirellula aureliae]